MFSNQYLATVRDESQQITKRIVYASSQSKAAAQLQKEKYRLISIEMRENPFWAALKKGKIEIGNPASKRELATFSNNLALMVQTKVNTANAFQILADSTPKERFRRVIMEARKRIMDGESISQGFANFPQVFDGVYVAIVQASETSGQLPIRAAGAVQGAEALRQSPPQAEERHDLSGDRPLDGTGRGDGLLDHGRASSLEPLQRHWS